MSANTVTIDDPGKRVAKVSKLLRKLRSDDRVVAATIVGIKRDLEMRVAAFENRSLSSHREWFFRQARVRSGRIIGKHGEVMTVHHLGD